MQIHPLWPALLSFALPVIGWSLGQIVANDALAWIGLFGGVGVAALAVANVIWGQVKITDAARSQRQFKAKLIQFAKDGQQLRGRWGTEDSDQLWAATEAWGNEVLRYLNSTDDGTRGDIFALEPNNLVQYASQRARPSTASNWLERRLIQLDQVMRGP